MLSFQQSRFPTTTQLLQDKQKRINTQSCTKNLFWTSSSVGQNFVSNNWITLVTKQFGYWNLISYPFFLVGVRNKKAPLSFLSEERQWEWSEWQKCFGDVKWMLGSRELYGKTIKKWCSSWRKISGASLTGRTGMYRTADTCSQKPSRLELTIIVYSSCSVLAPCYEL